MEVFVKGLWFWLLSLAFMGAFVEVYTWWYEGGALPWLTVAALLSGVVGKVLWAVVRQFEVR